MLKFFLGIFIFVNLSLNSQEKISHFKSIQTHLEDLYRITEDTLINYQGEIFPRLIFKDALHEELCFILKDFEQAEIIHKAYCNHILPNLPNEFLEPFSNALLRVCVLFGSNSFTPEISFLSSLKEENAVFYNWIYQNQDFIKKFIAQANHPARPNIVQNSKSDIYTIVILTTSASGGNHSVSNAIESFLSTSKNIRCINIDVEAIARKTDLIMLATGVTTYDGIYAKYFQQDNQGIDSLILRDLLSKELGKYIPSCLGLKLKELMRELNPDLILSTRCYTTDDIPLCTLGVPFRMIHCDYELSFFLMNLYGKVQPKMMKFWLPSLEPQIFRPLFEKKNRLDIYNEQDEIELLIKKIASITQQPEEIIQDQFELLGYPICSEFYHIANLKQIEQLRQKWEIQLEEIPILVSMGKNGVGILEEVFNELFAFPEHQLPFRYIFVCGKNLDLQTKLETKAREHKNSKSKFSIFGLISPREMNELMNLCPLYISKAGGSVTSEALETGTYLLIMCSHPWEEANESKIEQLGFGKKLQTNEPITLQIENCIDKILNLKKFSYKNIPWKELLIDHIKSIRKD